MKNASGPVNAAADTSSNLPADDRHAACRGSRLGIGAASENRVFRPASRRAFGQNRRYRGGRRKNGQAKRRARATHRPWAGSAPKRVPRRNRGRKGSPDILRRQAAGRTHSRRRERCPHRSMRGRMPRTKPLRARARQMPSLISSSGPAARKIGTQRHPPASVPKRCAALKSRFGQARSSSRAMSRIWRRSSPRRFCP